MNKLPRQRKCKSCKKPFAPVRPLQSVCGLQCATDHAKALKQSRELKEYRERKKALKTRSDYLKEAQIAFNAYVRARDYGKPCCSCGATPSEIFGGSMDCSHYRSRGSSPHLSFHLHNVASACVKCNRYLGGNVVALRAGLVSRIGEEKILAVEANDRIRKFDIEYLQRVKKIFTKKTLRAKKKCYP